jgi:hypothetical protein
MAHSARRVFGYILSPADRVIDRQTTLLCPPGTERISIAPTVYEDIFHLILGHRIREIDRAVQMRTAAALPFNHPMQPNQTGSLEALPIHIAPCSPVFRGVGAIADGEGEGPA